MPRADRTAEFVSLVQAAQKNRPSTSKPELPAVSAPDSFIVAARLIHSDLETLLRQLTAHRNAYLSLSNLSFPSASHIPLMSDSDRLKLEKQVLAVANKCQSSVENLKAIADQTSDSEDLQQHRQIIVFLLMRHIGLLTDRMKALREARARAQERQQSQLRSAQFEADLELARAKSARLVASRSTIANAPKLSVSSAASGTTEPSEFKTPKAATPDDEFENAFKQSQDQQMFALRTNNAVSKTPSQKSVLLPAVSKSISSASANSSVTLGTDLRQRKASSSQPLGDSIWGNSSVGEEKKYDTAIEEQLKQENMQMLYAYESELNSIRESEQKLEEISALMSDFSSKVLMQADTIESVHATTLLSSLHLTRGQQELKEATESSVNFRLFILLIMLVSGFSLLFLDRYQ